jgi:hypothetical protein
MILQPDKMMMVNKIEIVVVIVKNEKKKIACIHIAIVLRLARQLSGDCAIMEELASCNLQVVSLLHTLFIRCFSF